MNGSVATSIDRMEDLAVGQLDSGKLRRAERTLKGMLLLDADSIAAHFHLTRVYRRLRDYKTALRHGRRVLKLNPGEPNACLNLGLVYEMSGRHKLAERFYRQELARDPHNQETLYNLGRLYFNRKRWIDAAKYLNLCFQSGLQYNIDDTVKKIGQCYYEMGDLAAYIDLFQRYLLLFPKAAWGAANLGGALLRINDYKHGLLWLLKAKRLGCQKSLDAEIRKTRKMLSNAESQKNSSRREASVISIPGDTQSLKRGNIF